jgi:hypothetical protein
MCKGDLRYNLTRSCGTISHEPLVEHKQTTICSPFRFGLIQGNPYLGFKEKSALIYRNLLFYSCQLCMYFFQNGHCLVSRKDQFVKKLCMCRPTYKRAWLIQIVNRPIQDESVALENINFSRSLALTF